MPRLQWRTFSILVNDTPRKTVTVQARFPLGPDEWAALFDGLRELWRLEGLGQLPEGDIASVPVSARIVRKLQENREAGS